MKKGAAIMTLECSVPISKLQATAQVVFFPHLPDLPAAGVPDKSRWTDGHLLIYV
uniref:Uncharacterized protein n=1 Tax=Mus musculus TaxID=10090 RepID=Q3V472_MOUSE|nr:unnamed protein product [Mus musculus]